MSRRVPFSCKNIGCWGESRKPTWKRPARRGWPYNSQLNQLLPFNDFSDTNGFTCMDRLEQAAELIDLDRLLDKGYRVSIAIHLIRLHRDNPELSLDECEHILTRKYYEHDGGKPLPTKGDKLANAG